MRKRIYGMILTATVCCLLTGCFSNQSEHTGNQGQFSTITVAVRSGEQSRLRDLITGFENENPDIKIKLTELGSDLEQYRLITAAFSSEEYLFDVIEIEDVWVDDFADKNYIVPLQSSTPLSTGYIPFVAESFTRDGKVYAMPFQMDVGMMFSLKKYDWNGDFNLLAENRTEEPDEQLRAMNSDKEEVLCGLMELIKYTGNDVQRALKLYRDIYYAKGSEWLGVEEFKNKEIPIMRAWSSVIPQLRNETSKVAGEFHVHNMPRSSEDNEISTAKLYGFAISELSEKKELGERFIEYCSRDDVQIELIRKTGMYPMKLSLYDTPAINSVWGHIYPMKERISDVQLRPHMNEYMEQANNLQQLLSGYMAGSVPPDEAEKQVREFLNK